MFKLPKKWNIVKIAQYVPLTSLKDLDSCNAFTFDSHFHCFINKFCYIIRQQFDNMMKIQGKFGIVGPRPCYKGKLIDRDGKNDHTLKYHLLADQKTLQ